ncbi:hypothetical protein IJ118_00810 [Candidatus Saccharibacteria bacterium]|nr:hypothetical protein [Candidatus Saccharibacteria bacterium]
MHTGTYIPKHLSIRRPARVVIVLGVILALFACFLLQGASHSAPSAKDVAHEMAEAARFIGLPEDDPIIVGSKRIWHAVDVAETTLGESYYPTSGTYITVRRMNSGVTTVMVQETPQATPLNVATESITQTIPTVQVAPDMILMNTGLPYPRQVEPLYRTDTQNIVHNIAEKARWLGLSEDDPIIRRSSELWFEHERIHELLTSGDVLDIYNAETENDAIILAKIAFLEARGQTGIVEIACVVWSVLNRVDHPSYADSVYGIAHSGHVAYAAQTPTYDESTGRDYLALARDIIFRWRAEKAGFTDVGRVLPSDYFWWSGDGYHNHFRNDYYGRNGYWDYSLPSPYSLYA